MSKAILLSIRPEWLAKILNGEKTIEVRKLFPKDYVGWVYMYCSKGKPYLYGDKSVYEGKQEYFWVQKIEGNGIVPLLSGKVVARFWCDEVNSVGFNTRCDYPIISTWAINRLTRLSCLSPDQLLDYLQGKNGYAIHISKLEIFDKPRELSEFKRYIDKWDYYSALGKYTLSQPKEKLVVDIKKEFDASLLITKAPQNFCYIEGGN